MRILKLERNKTKLCLLVASVISLQACAKEPHFDTRQSTCLIIPSCPEYSQSFKNDLANEIERAEDNNLQVRVIIDYDTICKKIDIAQKEVCT